MVNQKQSPIIKGLIYLGLPWIPFCLFTIYQRIYILNHKEFEIYFFLTASFALVLSGIHIYRLLWTVLIHVQRIGASLGPGTLLFLISIVIVITITAIVLLFACAYAMVTFLSGPYGENYIVVGIHGQYKLEPWQLSGFFYFSTSTYFSLGYGDYLPRGSMMLALVYLESLLGYINSGILIAYAFNLFCRISDRPWDYKRSLRKIFRR